MSAAKELPKVISKTQDEIERIIALIESAQLPKDIIEFIIGCINLAVWLPRALTEHKITVSNLKRLIFGQGDKSQNRSKKKKNNSNKQGNNRPSDVRPSDEASNDDSIDEKPSRGHGRNPHDAYPGDIEQTISLDKLVAGLACPLNCGGKLYQIKPGILVNIKGQNIARVEKYWLEKLRCALCGNIFTADIPPGVSQEKYHPTFKAMLALQKYFLGMPFNRQAYFQSLLGFPLSSSTQWKLIEELASCVFPIFSALERCAANGRLIHNDDTLLRIVDLIYRNRQNPDLKRTGMYTTGILSHFENHKIALFYNSQRHSGENMEQLLNKRCKTTGKVIQMCDALSHNTPKNHETIACNCLSHGFRKFEDLKDFYPEHCLYLMKLLATPFKVDETCKERENNDYERLVYHQKHSRPDLLKAKAYMEQLLDDKLIEPNESLGKACRYMLKHWHKLTRFLEVEGAPVHNNDMERGLKIPIRGRNTWLFYKTEYGAMIGGVLTSIIYTCELSGINPFDYLVVLQEHKDQIIKEPNAWLPWNYQATLSQLDPALAA